MPGPVQPVCGAHALQVVSHGDALVVLHVRCLHVLPELGRARVRFRLGVPLFAVAFVVMFVVLFFFALSEPTILRVEFVMTTAVSTLLGKQTSVAMSFLIDTVWEYSSLISLTMSLMLEL